MISMVMKFKESLLPIASSLNSPLDQFILLICIFSSFPLGLINYFIKSPFIRLVYGLITGMALQFFLYEFDIIRCVISILITYVYIKFFARKSWSSPFYLLIILLLSLAYDHIVKIIYKYGDWSVDITVIHMIVLCKLSALGFSYEDGLKQDSEFVNEYQKTKKVVEEPSFLELFSYTFYYSSAVAGPYFDFSDFKKFIYLKEEYSIIPTLQAIYYSLYDLITAFGCTFIFLNYKSAYDVNLVCKPEFNDYYFFYKIYYLNIAMIINGMKYYLVWKLTTSANVFNGLAYNPNSKVNEEGETTIEHNFDKFNAVYILKILFNPNPKQKIEGWNHQVHIWLKYHVMLRFVNVSSKFIKNNRILFTYMVSSIWHGFYPVYYWFFLDFYFVDQISSMLEKDKFFERLEHSSYILQIICNFIGLHACNYLGVTFALLTFENVLNYYKNMYFIPNICVYLLYIYLAFIKTESKKITRLEPGKPLDLSKIGKESSLSKDTKEKKLI